MKEGSEMEDLGFVPEPAMERSPSALPAEAGVAGGWKPIDSAPKDRMVIVATDGAHGLEPFTTICQWHTDAGFCVCELRNVTHWRPLPPPPGQDEMECVVAPRDPTEAMVQAACDATFGKRWLSPEQYHRAGYAAMVAAAASMTPQVDS